MAVDDKDDDRDLTVREEHDGSAVVVYADAEPAGDAPAGDTEKTAPAGEDDGEDDVQLTAAEAEGKTEEEREEIRKRRRAERQHRKNVRKEREEMLQRQLESERQARQALEQRILTIEQRGTGNELAQLEVEIKKAADAHMYFKGLIAEAASKNDGATVADATEKMMLARQRGQELINVRNAYVERQAAPPPLDPRLLNHAQAWLNENKWYDPNGKDEDSRIMRVVDDGVKADGFDPTTPAYWEELTNRAKARFPHRYGSSSADQDGGQRQQRQQRQQRSTVTGSDKSASQTPAGNRFEFRLSAERVAAIKEAGAWDDPVKRNKMIQRYREYDATHKA